jgi:hypothetical protein
MEKKEEKLMKLLSETTNQISKERNSRGKMYESEVQSSIEDIGFEYHTGTPKITILAAWRKPVFFREVPMPDIYGSQHKVDFLLISGLLELVVECKSQTFTVGTTDVKLLEIPLNSEVYNRDTILAYEGDKFRPKIINYMTIDAPKKFSNYLGAFKGDGITNFIVEYFGV